MTALTKKLYQRQCLFQIFVYNFQVDRWLQALLFVRRDGSVQHCFLELPGLLFPSHAKHNLKDGHVGHRVRRPHWQYHSYCLAVSYRSFSQRKDSGTVHLQPSHSRFSDGSLHDHNFVSRCVLRRVFLPLRSAMARIGHLQSRRIHRCSLQRNVRLHTCNHYDRSSPKCRVPLR